MNFERISSELVRALRAGRSQKSMSLRLGYSTNVLYSWEHGRSSPTATQLLEMAERCGHDTRTLLRSFYVKAPPWLNTMKAFPSRAGVAAFIRNQRGDTAVGDLAQAVGVSRFVISRWLRGSGEPKLPEFLSVIHHLTSRLGEWVGLFVDLDELPSLRLEWKRQEAARRAAARLPWTQAVLRAMELEAYQALHRHEPGWFAERLGISARDEQRCLSLLASSQQITLQSELWGPAPAGATNLRKDPSEAVEQRAFWTRVAADRANRAKGMFAYNVCALSERDLDRLKALQRTFLQQARSIIASSHPVQRVALVQTQIFALDENPPAQG
jgi:transcriptional regulator with XRE-family HTH domain